MTLISLHMKLRYACAGKEGLKHDYSAADFLLQLNQVNPIADLVEPMDT